MTVDLLSIVQAEEHAEKMLEEAKAERERVIAAALAERERKLAALKPPKPRKIPVPDVKTTRVTKSKARMDRAVKRILEGVDALA